MKKTAKQLIFISQIKRDGSGTLPVSESYLKAMLENLCMKDDKFSLQCLSITEGTYIASKFNSFVVKLANQKVTIQASENNGVLNTK